MSLPFRTGRVAVLLSLLSLAFAALAKPPLPDEARAVAVLVVAAVAALSARSSLLMIAARRRSLVIDDKAQPHRLLLASVPAAVVAAALASPLLLLPSVHSRFEVLVAGLAGVVVGVALASRDRRPKGPRKTTLWRWLILDTALPSGIIAALVGVTVAFLRLHSQDLVTAGVLARHLATTTFFYAVLLGWGALFKTYGEQSAGLVIVDKSTRQVPSPMILGGVIGIALLLVVPLLVPSLPLVDVLVVKGVAGFVLGGGLSLLGAMQGARAASLGLTGRDLSS